MKRLSVLLMSCLLIISGCQKDEPFKPEDNKGDGDGTSEDISEMVLNPGTVILDESITKYILGVDESEIKVSPLIPSEDIPEKGNIIVCSVTENTPYGFIGRIVDIVEVADGYLWKTEQVSLTEAFNTLRIKRSLDLSEYVEEITDEEGNIIEYKVVGGEILEDIASDPEEYEEDPDDEEDIDIETKVDKEANIEKCLEFDLDNDNLKGKFYIQFTLDVDIDISWNKVNSMSYVLKKKAGVKGNLEILSEEAKAMYPLLHVSIPVSPIVMAPLPIVLRPSINSDLALLLEGKVNIGSEFHYLIYNTDYEVNYKDGAWNSNVKDVSNKQENYFKLSSIEINGGFGFDVSSGMELALFSTKLPSVGFDISAAYMANTNLGFELSAGKMLEMGAKLIFTPTVTARVYCEAEFFGKQLAKYEATKELMTYDKLEIPIVPSVTNMSARIINGKIESLIDYFKRSILKTQETGVALFKDETAEKPVEHTEIPDDTPKESVDTEIDFDSSVSQTEEQEYYIAPYIVHEGKYYYGEKIKVIKDIRDILIRFYEDTGGDNWRNNENWCSDKPVRTWYGVTLDYVTPMTNEPVYRLYLNNNNLKGNADLSNCQQLSYVELNDNSLTGLDLYGCSILRDLRCSGCDLQYLDIRGCTSLESVNCQDNEITEIPLSGCTSLLTFIGRNNNLSTLDFRYSPLIQVITCNNNKLSSFSVSEANDLKNIDCQSNSMTSFDVSGCPSLEYINVADNRLEHLSLNECPALKEMQCNNNNLPLLELTDYVSLQYIDCENNPFETINISGCTSLSYFDTGSSTTLHSLDVSDCSSLERLDCSDNIISRLNLDGCNSLNSLDCAYNRLTSIDLSGYTELTYLSVNDNPLTVIDISGCTQINRLDVGKGTTLYKVDVSGCSSLESLWLSDNIISELNFSGCNSMKEIFIENNRLTSLDLSRHTLLENVQCDGNPLRSIDLSDCIRLKSFSFENRVKNNTLTSLDVSGCSFLQDLECFDGILATLDVSGCTSLENLRCHDNNLTRISLSGTQSLQSILCHNNKLTSLNLSGRKNLYEINCENNNISSFSISGCTSLKYLLCSENKIRMQIPDWFTQLERFEYDVRYTNYHREDIYIEIGGQQYPTGETRLVYTDNGYGWWYSGEPTKGYHGI